MGDLLTVRDLEVQFRVHDIELHALRGISFRVQPGATVALVGESGSGKSVTAQCIMGILPDIARITGGEIVFHSTEPSLGTVDIARLDREGSTMRRIRGRHISIIFQEPMASLSPLHTIGDQVSEALFLHREAGRREGLELTTEMLRLVGFPDARGTLKLYPFELSGGLRQRAMIAMALICRPALLIADEPTTALDVTIQAQILKLMKDLQAELGMAVLLITHDLGVVANLADEVVVMYHGRVTESGPAVGIFEHPRHPYLKSLLRAVPHFDMHAGERLVPVREIEHETGPLLVKRAGAGGPAGKTKTQLIVESVSKAFATRKAGLWGTKPEALIKAVDDVSFTVARGECFGLVGESGCGKTTLGKILMRAVRPDSGAVRYRDGERDIDVLALDGDALMAFRQKMQFIFQDPYGSLNPRMTVFDIVREPLVIHARGDMDYQAEMAQELMRLVGLDPRFLNRYPHSFSGGQRQRIGIARALALQPELLICDEPVSALDVSIQAQILNLLKDLQSELGLTYLFVSHNLAVINYMAHRIAVMYRGRLVEVAPREVVFQAPLHPYTRALLKAVPYPDLDRPVDFDAVTGEAAGGAEAWPDPFALRGAPTHLVDVGNGHLIRIQADASPRDLVA
ncbi:MAG: ABC transporter ATP-binding protein [Gammaproteobacteria bacterium]|nr:ABC transporter ATP-binding protein [Gammaproteobacteria bacterium]NIR85654.1 ABC transporter ATP-binding protein [Gammaproteobacteria bacterium]NIR90142.1 ABC transporter ATP-binding protein [Gammaproteobacteria bacterium]NIU06788.1 ABC transporter ATP-binding protein [Gammaproteobacteria bacterium]NIV53721.1 dipeptide ABC transporter ATP-binding protein [Gammaproteobacteria bacterium]